MRKVRPFYLERHVDESGMSGTGYVAEGVQLPTDLMVMWWLVEPHSVQVYASAEDLVHVHGHGDARTTELVWKDDANDGLEFWRDRLETWARDLQELTKRASWVEEHRDGDCLRELRGILAELDRLRGNLP